MKNYFATLLIIIIYGTGHAYAQTFNQDPGNPNLDFSMGNFTNWQLSWGKRNNPDSVSGPVSVSSHVVFARTGANYDGALYRVPDSFLTHTARLGMPTGGGLGNSLSYKLKYNITVNAQYPILFFQLASIMDRTHDNSNGGQDNTHYKFALKDALGNSIPVQPCTGLRLFPKGGISTGTIPSITYVGQGSSLGFKQPWESVAINLSSYAGQTLTLEFEHYDCIYGYHGSFSYVTAGMRKAVDTFYYCKGATSVTVNPYIPRFHSYLWSTGATTDSIIVSSPVDGATYTCAVGSYNSCATTFTYILKEIKVNPDFTTTGGNICNQIQFYNNATTNKGYIESWHWNFGDPVSGAANTATETNPLHTYPAPGDYTITLTVTDTNGCSNTISKVINVSPDGITAQIRLPDTTCVHETLTFEDITAGSSRRFWIIDGITQEDTTEIIQRIFSQPGRYEVTLIAIGSNGCPDTLTQNFEVHGPPDAGIEPYPNTATAPITDPSFTFKGLEKGAAAYIWDFGYGGATGAGEYVKFTYPPELAQYIVTVKTYNQYGCFDTASVAVSLMPPDFFMPSAFSPNGDGTNDVFRVINITNQRLLDFSIYNRFGQRIFYTINPGNGWDGTFSGQPCEVGVYYYVVLVAYPDGTQKMVKGDVTLIR